MRWVLLALLVLLLAGLWAAVVFLPRNPVGRRGRHDPRRPHLRDSVERALSAGSRQGSGGRPGAGRSEEGRGREGRRSRRRSARTCGAGSRRSEREAVRSRACHGSRWSERQGAGEDDLPRAIGAGLHPCGGLAQGRRPEALEVVVVPRHARPRGRRAARSPTKQAREKWLALLEGLRPLRRDRPLDGVVVTVSLGGSRRARRRRLAPEARGRSPASGRRGGGSARDGPAGLPRLDQSGPRRRLRRDVGGAHPRRALGGVGRVVRRRHDPTARGAGARGRGGG